MAKLGIIGAGGDLPLRIRDGLKAKGEDALLIGLEGVASDQTCKQADHVLSVGEVSALVYFLKSNNVRSCVMIGPMSRPDLASLKVDAGGQVVLSKFMGLAGAGGDDALLGCLVNYFEENGLEVIGAEDLITDFIAPLGCLTKEQTNDWRQDIAFGVALLKDLSVYDVGQACVIKNRQVLAIEGPEGTDAMLLRVRNINKTVSGLAGVLVKLPKVGQEKRVDLPAIGPLTIKNAISAGLAGIVFQQSGALFVDREQCIAIANGAGFFIEGLAP